MGFMIHPSNPDSMYMGASFSESDADTAKMGTRPLCCAASERGALGESFSNFRIILAQVMPSTIGI